MSKWILLGCMVLAACDARAAPAADGRLLLVDSAVKQVSIEPYQHAFQTKEVRPASGYAWEPPTPGVGEKLAVTTVAVLLMGPAGAGYASGAQAAAVREARAKWLQPLLRITGADENGLSTRMLATLRSSLADIGMPVDRVVLSPDAKGAVLQRAAREETSAVVIRARYGSLVTVTADDRRVVIAMWVEGYKRPVERFRQRTGRFPLRYVSAPMQGVDAIARWTGNDAALFWDEIDRGLRALVPASVMELPADVRKDERVALNHAGRGEEFKGRLVQRIDDLAYIAEPDGGLMIVHDRAPLGPSPSP